MHACMAALLLLPYSCIKSLRRDLLYLAHQQLLWLLDRLLDLLLQQPDAPDPQHAALSKGLQSTDKEVGAEQVLPLSPLL